jgi:hypothetical protein
MSWTITGQSVNAPLLDIYSGAAAAYSLRQLQSGSYPVVRVRRSSDNTESDFTATEVSDGTLATWVGAGNDGFVRTWYDQSSNGNNATQSTAATQPTIVSNGTLVTEGGKPAISFNGDVLQRNGNSLSFPVFTFSVVKSTGNGIRAYLGSGANQLAFGQQQGGSFAPVNSFWAWAPSQASTFGLLNSYNSNRNLHSYWIPNATESEWKWYLNTVESGSPGLTSGAPTGASLTLIGFNGSGNEYWQGPIQEILIYQSDQSANRNGIEANINAHYSIF